MQIAITHQPDTGTITVTSPYAADYVSRARALGGRWDRTAGGWVFDEAAEPAVRQALRECYGTDGGTDAVPEASVTLYVYVPEALSAARGPVVLDGPITLARAFGRDSGAKLGDGVAHLAGPKPTSGGSVKNWDTRVPAGGLYAVYQVPRGLAERAQGDADVVCRLGDGSEATAAVLAEMQAQAARAALPAAEAELRRVLGQRREPVHPTTLAVVTAPGTGIRTARDYRVKVARQHTARVRALRAAALADVLPAGA